MENCYDCNHCEVCRWIDKFKDKDVCDFYENGTPLNEPFINKSCVSNEVCEHDKNEVLDKIRAEIMEDIENGVYDALHGDKYASTYLCGMRHALEIIDKYKAESEE